MVVMSYKTEDGLADYGFSIEFHVDIGWRIFIVFQPSYHSDDNKADSPYRAVDHNGHPYVNWPLKLTSLADARTVAALWAELDQRYHDEQRASAPRKPRTRAS